MPKNSRERARLGALTKHYGSDHPWTQEARRDVRFGRLKSQILDAVDQAPPLNLDQLNELRALLGAKPGDV